MDFIKIKDHNGLEHFINKNFIVAILTIEDQGTQILLNEGADISTSLSIEDFEKLLK